VQRLGDRAFCRCRLAGHQDVGSDGPTRWINSSTGRIDTASAISIGRTSGFSDRFSGLETLLTAQRARELHLRAHDRQDAGVLPRLLDEVAGAAAHRLHRHLDAAPGGHDDDRQGRIVARAAR